MVTIGITGPTGAGKTTALRELEKLGGCVLDADAVYHELLEQNFELRQALTQRFGLMEDAQGHFDRKQLGAIVFRDTKAMEELNTITRPFILDALHTRLSQAEKEGYPASAVDVIRLFESGLDRICQVTLAVLAPSEIRVRRIMAREGISEEYARARVLAQPPDCFYTQRCDYTLVNDCDGADAFGAKARALFESILYQGIQ